MKPEDFLKEVKGAFSALDTSKKVEQATVEPEARSIKSMRLKGAVDKATERLIDQDVLSKNFEDACRTSKDFVRWGFGSDRALQEPRDFIRKKDANGQYVVKTHQLNSLINTLLNAGAAGFMKEGKGVPIHEAVDMKHYDAFRFKLGNTLGQAFADEALAARVQKDLTTSTGASLIRTDLEQVLYEAYLRVFPFIEQLPTEPANGVVHTYNVRTAPPTGVNISEIGSYAGNFTNSTIAQRSSAIAVTVSPVGVGVKFQYAVSQSGMNYDVTGANNIEVMGALIGIALKEQYNFLQGNQSTAAKTLSDEEGLTDANGIDGLRTLLKGASYSVNKGSTEAYIKVINRVVARLINAGASVEDLMIVLSVNALTDVNTELLQFLRDINGTGGALDTARASRYGLVTVGGWESKLLPIPASAQSNGMGYYTYNAAATEDIDILDPNSLSTVYLGSPTPTVLELPVGYNNTLSNIYVPFSMKGLALKLPEFNRKIRIDQVNV